MTQVTLPPSRFPAVKPLFLLPPSGPSSCADRKGGLRPTLSPARPFGLFCVFVSGPVMDVSFFGKFRSLTRMKDISSTLSPNSTPTPAFFVPSRMQQVTSCEKKMHFPSCTLPFSRVQTLFAVFPAILVPSRYKQNHFLRQRPPCALWL